MTLKPVYSIVKCGHSNCDKKGNCPHYADHKRETSCNECCVISGNSYKCYNIIEQRKIKLKKLEPND